MILFSMAKGSVGNVINFQEAGGRMRRHPSVAVPISLARIASKRGPDASPYDQDKDPFLDDFAARTDTVSADSPSSLYLGKVMSDPTGDSAAQIGIEAAQKYLCRDNNSNPAS